MDVQVYRPGPFLAVGILALPVIVALAGAAVALLQNTAIPVWLPFVLLLWIPCMPIAWRGMKSVRTNAIGLAAGRPWGPWQEIPWPLVERVDQSRGTIRVQGSNGVRIVVVPALLREGGRLKRQMLLRLPAHVLSPPLAHEAQTLLAAGVYTLSGGGLTGTLHARPRRRWRIAASALVVALLAAATASIVVLPPIVAIPLVAISLGLAGCGMAVLAWLLQEVLVSEKGITAISSFSHRARGMTWNEVQLVEHSAAQAILRLRGSQRITCIGPTLLSATERDLMRAFLYEYCVYREVPVIRRRWLL
jgi:hypothetical protein